MPWDEDEVTLDCDVPLKCPRCNTDLVFGPEQEYGPLCVEIEIYGACMQCEILYPFSFRMNYPDFCEEDERENDA